jgi:hypothetical protein
MSGQPCNTFADTARYRAKYLATLATQIANDRLNLEANQIFKKTGETPVQPTDNRTTEDKYADLERLKILIRAKLNDIMDNRTAEAVSQELENRGPDDIIFAANNLDELMRIVKSQYQIGVQNPEQFFSVYDRFRDKMLETFGVDRSVSLQDILENTINRHDLAAVEAMIRLCTQTNIRVFRQLQDDLVDLAEMIPTPAQIEEIQRMNNPILRAEMLADIQDILQHLPSKSELNTLLHELFIAIKANDDVRQEETLAAIHQILAQQPEVLAKIEVLKRDIPAREIGFEYIDPTSEEFMKMKKLDLVRYVRNLSSLWNQREGDNPFKQNGNLDAFLKKSAKEIKETILDNDARIRRRIGGIEAPRLAAGGESPSESGFGLGLGRHRMTGMGLQSSQTRRVSSRIRPEQVDFRRGVSSTPKYVPFGRYLIHKPKLNDNIVKIASHSGAGVNGFKTLRVSRHMGDVLRKIVGGGNPSYEEVGGLSDDEKDYLHKLAKKSQILDRLTIPAPNKSREDKLSDRFDVLKGEIQAGNTSTEVIKEFKLLLLNLSNRDLLPKGQAKDVLLELVAMGY